MILIVALLACHKDEPADAVFVNGTVHPTVDTTATAMAVRGDAIVALDDDVEDLRGEGTEKVDLGGGHVYAGSHDGHTHLLAGNFAFQRLLVLNDSSSEQLAADALAYADDNPDEPWIVGYGWLAELVDDPSGVPLTAALPDRPAILIGSSGHMAIVNQCAMDLAGIDASTPDPSDGTITRDDNGNPTGYLVEGAISLVSDVVIAAYDAAMSRGLADQLQTFSASGLTSISEILAVPGISLARPWIYKDLDDQGLLPLRVTWYEPVFSIDDLAAIDAIRDQYEGTLVHFGGGKVWVDGSMGTVESWVSEPYEGTTDDYGSHYFDEAQLEQLITEAEARKMSLKFHANGDAAVTATLDALEAVDQRQGLTQIYDMEHVVLLSADDRARIAQLGLTASVQPSHYVTASNGDAAAALGSRFADAYNYRGLIDAGVALSLGTDWPVWPVPDPLLTMWNADIRNTSGNPNGITAEEALRGYTEGGASLVGRSDDLGRLEVGYQADFVVYGDDPLEVDVTELPDVPIEQVWVAGKRVQ